MLLRRYHKTGLLKKQAVLLALLACLLLSGCQSSQKGETSVFSLENIVGHMELQYAEQFAVDYYADGSALLTIAGAERYLILPETCEVPSGLEADITVIRQPATNIYLASSSAADLFSQIDALDHLRLTSTSSGNWRLPELQQAMDNGSILYAGKYSAPDFELVLSENCDLVIENTMIFHSPEIKEKLETLGMPVLVEYSSYEPQPLGRVEWIKVYGLLTGKEEAAQRFFDRQVQIISELEDVEKSGKTVAFFYINSNGNAVVRKPGDYVSKMIELAGGSYAFSDIVENDNALSTINMQMEAFYAAARDADVLIYNSTVGSEIYTIQELLQKSELLADFKAVQEGNVWCTEQSMFQQTSAVAGMISDINAALSEDESRGEELQFLHKLN